MELRVENLKYGYKKSEPILKKVNMTALPGKITAIIGQNGEGKSTMLKCISGLFKYEGNVFLDKKELKKLSKEEIIDSIGYLIQENENQAELNVFETVLLGRLNSLSWKVSKEESNKVWKVIEDLGIKNLAKKNINELSGGQKRMVYIAQTVVREPNVLLLDEPISNLDLKRQLEVLDLIKDLTKKRNLTTVLIIHDLNMAARYADQLVVLKNGEIYLSGKPKEVFTKETIKDIYNVNAKVYIDEDGIPFVNPISAIGKK
ncbi:ABC transporter ATP-binding protein [Clostridium botulinum]|nr:ABC transporter ATP-binding protein [Clostridium botulinum]